MLQITPSATAVPLLIGDRVIGEITQDQLDNHGFGGLQLVLNRKGYIRRVVLRPSIYTSSKGDCFEQHLPHGRVCFALTGVAGS